MKNKIWIPISIFVFIVGCIAIPITKRSTQSISDQSIITATLPKNYYDQFISTLEFTMNTKDFQGKSVLDYKGKTTLEGKVSFNFVDTSRCYELESDPEKKVDCPKTNTVYDFTCQASIQGHGCLAYLDCDDSVVINGNTYDIGVGELQKDDQGHYKISFIGYFVGSGIGVIVMREPLICPPCWTEKMVGNSVECEEPS